VFVALSSFEADVVDAVETLSFVVVVAVAVVVVAVRPNEMDSEENLRLQ